jgi:effector-binding domain-containing protein
MAYYPAMPDELFDVEAGMPTAVAIEPAGDVVPLVLPHGRVARGVHVGPYDTLTDTYGQLLAWLAEHGESPCEQMWESYLSDPTPGSDPATWRTEVVWLLHAAR